MFLHEIAILFWSLATSWSPKGAARWKQEGARCRQSGSAGSTSPPTFMYFPGFPGPQTTEPAGLRSQGYWSRSSSATEPWLFAALSFRKSTVASPPPPWTSSGTFADVSLPSLQQEGMDTPVFGESGAPTCHFHIQPVCPAPVGCVTQGTKSKVSVPQSLCVNRGMRSSY